MRTLWLANLINLVLVGALVLRQRRDISGVGVGLPSGSPAHF